MGGHHSDMERGPRTDGGGVVEYHHERATHARRTSHEQPAIERHELPGTIPVGAYHEYHHADRWPAADTPLADRADRLTADEWLTYDVDIAERGPYDLTFRVATADGADAVLGIVVDDDPLRRLTVSSDGWHSWTDADTWVDLPDGLHTIRVVVLDGDVKLESTEFR